VLCNGTETLNLQRYYKCNLIIFHQHSIIYFDLQCRYDRDLQFWILSEIQYSWNVGNTPTTRTLQTQKSTTPSRCRTGWSSGNDIELHWVGAWFDSLPGHQPSWEVFHGFPQSFFTNAGMALGQDNFLRNPFQFIVNQSSCHPTLYTCSFDTGSAIK
jgi:hypothetical protein